MQASSEGRLVVTVAMLPELALGTARVAREIAPGPASAELIDAMLNQTSLFLHFIADYRDAVVAELDDKGIDLGALGNACQNSLETLDRASEARGTLATHLVKDEHKREFKRQEDLTAQLRQAFAGWLEMANRPFPPIDLKKLEEDARADVEAGRMIRVEQFEDLFPSHSEAS
jgi:hypothetical protein